jgi:hypothetical protein
MPGCDWLVTRNARVAAAGRGGRRESARIGLVSVSADSSSRVARRTRHPTSTFLSFYVQLVRHRRPLLRAARSRRLLERRARGSDPDPQSIDLLMTSFLLLLPRKQLKKCDTAQDTSGQIAGSFKSRPRGTATAVASIRAMPH